ncbi:T9SS type A sorting domain-containing protein [Aridibaculum aurantiacum]|uniref:T9SS type A sorting domain-containing protein n=1 Tax=Aridibaculum aurantiacum TaxID=2810307 RepID=UPI001A962461|nr:T9SS type A sorting domain-containing protein [Aridibaculum aurantiacum]
MKLKSTLFSFTILFLLTQSQAQQISFPGAEGAGRFTSGGRGTPTVPTTIYEVTTLADGTDNTVGTFRWAVRNNSPAAAHRTVIFRVSGTIRLTSPLTINRSNTTIAGQTAPGDGICIADYPVTISADNLIIRYIRFRLGDRHQQARSGGDDALGGTGRKNIIIDHCTFSWSNDELLSVYTGDSTTLQWNMLSEPLDSSYHVEGGPVQRHGYGGIWGGRRASFHHNLFAHLRGRAPRFDGSRNLPNSSSPVVGSENADYRNNVIYNWADYNVNGGEGGKYNIVNNYYKWGPNTPTSNTGGVSRRNLVLNPSRQSSPALPYGKFYLEGNFVENSAAVTARNWLGVAMSGGTQADTNQSKVEVPFNIAPVTTQSAQDAYISVLNGAGAILPKRDTLDQRIVNDVINRTGRLINVQGGHPWGTPFSSSESAWPTLVQLPAPTDTDKDGMPDAWELRRGLNPSNAADRNGYNTNGYTNLENYLNGDSIVAFGTNNTCITGKTIVTNGSGDWRHATDTTYSTVSSTDTLNAIASILDNGNTGNFTVSYYTTNSTRFLNSKPYLNRNITITPSDPSAISTPLTVRLYISQQEFAELQAADNTIASVSDLKVVKTSDNNCPNSLTGNYEMITPTATGVFGTYANGYYIEFQTASFSTFFIGSQSLALPLHLVSFAGSYNGSKVNLQWRTQNEVNTATFEIEKSKDAVSFSTIGTVAAAGNSSSRQYGFTEPELLQGKAYYRLKMIDIDGRFTYSQVISFSQSKSQAFVVNPNPASSNIIINHPKAIAGASLQVVSLEGKRLLNHTLTAGALQTSLYIGHLAPGIYLVVLNNGGERMTQRIIKN